MPAPRAHLRSSLVKFYAAILHFMFIVIKIYGQNKLKRSFALWQDEEISKLQVECQSCEEDARIAAELCNSLDASNVREDLLKELKTLPTMQDLKSLLEPLYKGVSAIWSTMQEIERNTLLTWLSEISYQDDHKDARKGRTELTGHWIFQRSEYENWENSEKSSILLLNGGGESYFLSLRTTQGC